MYGLGVFCEARAHILPICPTQRMILFLLLCTMLPLWHSFWKCYTEYLQLVEPGQNEKYCLITFHSFMQNKYYTQAYAHTCSHAHTHMHARACTHAQRKLLARQSSGDSPSFTSGTDWKVSPQLQYMMETFIGVCLHIGTSQCIALACRDFTVYSPCTSALHSLQPLHIGTSQCIVTVYIHFIVYSSELSATPSNPCNPYSITFSPTLTGCSALSTARVDYRKAIGPVWLSDLCHLV